jgi:hypothetical protein
MMRCAMLTLVILLSSHWANAQDTSNPPHDHVGFEGVHADLTTILWAHSARAGLDWSLVRSGNFWLGVKPSFIHAYGLGEDPAHSPSMRYGAAFLAIAARRSARSHLELSFGPYYFWRYGKENWRWYTGGDLRIPLADQYLGLLLHISNENLGLGFSIGYTRN